MGFLNIKSNNELQFLADLEPCTLEDRQRVGKTPVGLKNIGNTWYLNSYIQALYHLPMVMETIMGLQETNELHRQSSLNTMKRIESCYKLIIQMKLLFAFMTKSEKKYADPTAMIRNIVDDFGNQMKIGDQQDISEVSEGFITRLHEGVQAIVNPFVVDKNEPSPFSEEAKDEANASWSESSEEIEKRSLLDRVEEYAKSNESEGFIKDLFYGKQVETTELEGSKGQESLEESEFLLILLNTEVDFKLFNPT